MVTKKKKETLDLKTLLENTPEVLNFPNFGEVTVRCPTTLDKLDAKREALQIGKGLTDEDIINEQARILATKMIVKPKLTVKAYLDSNDAKISVLLDSVHLWYNLKMKAYNEQRQELVKTFLEQLKEK